MNSLAFNSSEGYYWHTSAIINFNAEIGKGTKIWQWTHIMTGAEIGENCIIGQNVFIGKNVKIGNGCKIQNCVSIFEGVELEDFVFVGPGVKFTNVKYPRAAIEKKHEFQETLVKKHATIGAGAIIICGNTIGEYAFIGAGAVITKSVPAHVLMVGNPAQGHGTVGKNGVPHK